MSITLNPSRRWALFLDVDGTVVPIADHPDAVSPSPRLGALLSQTAAALNGALALVSGRSIASIEALTGYTGPAAGLHGLETRTADGRYFACSDNTPALARARQTLQQLVADYPELYLEDKQATLALHYRGASTQATEAARQTVDAIVTAAHGTLSRLAGKAVYELKPDQGDKGTALRWLLDTEPFPGRCPVFIGDDVTDEDGFAAANALGGLSIRVGQSSHGGDTPASHARYQLDSVDNVLAWLATVTRQLEQATQ